MMTNQELKRMYGALNRKYFGNRLPKDMVVRFGKIRELGLTRFYWERPCFILINKGLAVWPTEAKLTLIHEMVHVEQTDLSGHGYRFDRRMLQLAKAGAFNGLW